MRDDKGIVGCVPGKMDDIDQMVDIIGQNGEPAKEKG